MYVYQLLADREGRKAPPCRMKKTPVEEMRAEVAAQDSQVRRVACHRVPERHVSHVCLPHLLTRCDHTGVWVQAPLQKNWVEIQDPLTGEVCWWNQVTKVTVWTRPTQVTTA